MSASNGKYPPTEVQPRATRRRFSAAYKRQIHRRQPPLVVFVFGYGAGFTGQFAKQRDRPVPLFTSFSRAIWRLSGMVYAEDLVR